MLYAIFFLSSSMLCFLQLCAVTVKHMTMLLVFLTSDWLPVTLTLSYPVQRLDINERGARDAENNS